MNVVEELKTLDVNDVGRWPFVFRAAVIVIVFALVTGLGVYWTIVKDKAPQLDRARAEEQELRNVFENKQKKAANYDATRLQELAAGAAQHLFRGLAVGDDVAWQCKVKPGARQGRGGGFR